MAEIFPDRLNSGRPPGKIRWRTLAMIIMITGAAGFAVALVFYNENVLCLSVSTLTTLAGLGLLITARRRGWEPADEVERRHSPEPGAFRSARSGSIPRGLRAYRPAQAPIVDPAAPAGAAQGRVGPVEARLVDQVQAIFTAQGAYVTVETLRLDRSVLRVTTPNGVEHIALVLENQSPAEAAEGRALLALLNQPDASLNGLGFVISAGGFSPSAYRWAEGRGQIRLVSADELDELGI